MLGCLGVLLVVLAATLFIPLVHFITFPIFVVVAVAFLATAIMRFVKR